MKKKILEQAIRTRRNGKKRKKVVLPEVWNVPKRVPHLKVKNLINEKEAQTTLSQKNC